MSEGKPPPIGFVTKLDTEDDGVAAQLDRGVSNVAKTFFSCSSGVPARLSEQEEKAEEAPIPEEVTVDGVSKNGLIFRRELSMSGVLSEIGVTPPPLPPPPPPPPPPVGGPGVTSSD